MSSVSHDPSENGFGALKNISYQYWKPYAAYNLTFILTLFESWRGVLHLQNSTKLSKKFADTILIPAAEI